MPLRSAAFGRGPARQDARKRPGYGETVTDTVALADDPPSLTWNVQESWACYRPSTTRPESAVRNASRSRFSRALRSSGRMPGSRPGSGRPPPS